MKDQRAVYLNHILSPDRRTRIVDIGANPLDEPPYRTLLENGLCDIWGFEPQESGFEKLVAEASARETYLPYAIGDGTEGNLHVCKGEGFTSLYAPNPEFIELTGRWPKQMRVEEVIPFKTRRLDDIEEIPEFDLLKIDVQGSETTIFENGREKLSSALAVITEAAFVPLYVDQPLFDAQMRALQAQGFEVHKFLFFTQLNVNGPSAGRLRARRVRNQLVDGDVVFLRSLFGLSDFTHEALKHLAILADAVFESYDVALLALDHLAQRDVISQASIDRYIAQLPPEIVQ